jgi:hypothetical protein
MPALLLSWAADIEMLMLLSTAPIHRHLVHGVAAAPVGVAADPHPRRCKGAYYPGPLSNYIMSMPIETPSYALS